MFKEFVASKDYFEWLSKFDKIKHEDWDAVKQKQSLHRREFFSRIMLWNAKYYEFEEGSDFDGSIEHKIPNLTKKEIPYSREFFRLSRGRFALKNHAVSYWSGDYSVARCEVTEELKTDAGFSLQQIIDFTKNNEMLVPQHRYLKLSAKILDLTDKDYPFFHLLEKYNIFESAVKFYEEIVWSKNKAVYPITQALATKAFENEFDGIVWRSMRGPNDFIACGGYNVILFNEESISENRDASISNDD